MANRFLVAGGTGNWDSATNWSATDGGASGASAPVLGDAVLINSNSGNANLTVNVSSACTSLVVSGTYTGTLTFNAQLTVSGTITFISGMTLAGTTGPLVPNSTATLTSGGKTIPCPLTFGISATYTLADNWTVTGLMTAGVTTGTTTINGAFSLTCNGGYHQGGTSALVAGTAKIVLGGGTWDSTSTGRTSNNLDLAGTVTVSGTVAYGTGTLTYVSGTITTTGSTLSVGNNSTTFNTSGATWNSVSLGLGTFTFSSTFAWSGTLTITNTATLTGAGALNGTGAIVPASATLTINNTGGITTTGTMTLPNANATFAGSAGWTVGTLTTATLTGTRTHTLTFGNTYTVTALLTNAATPASRQSLVSGTPGSKVVFNVTPGALESLAYCDPTDIDSSGGATVTSVGGTITTSLNWSSTVNTAPSATTTLVNCMITQHTDSWA